MFFQLDRNPSLWLLFVISNIKGRDKLEDIAYIVCVVLSSKVNQMVATLNMSSFNNRDSLLGPNIKQGDIMNRTNGLNNHGLVGFQWKIMKGM